MNLTDIISDIGSGQWLALTILIAAYLRRIVAADSKFPITIAPAWRPVLAALVGAVFGGLTARSHGATVGASSLFVVMSAGGLGIGDMVLSAVWAQSSTAPSWARALVFVFDDLTRGGAPAMAAKAAKPISLKPPSSQRGRSLPRGCRVALASFALLLIGCAAIYPMLGKVEQLVLDDVVAGKTPEAIETDVAVLLDGKVGGDVAKIVQDAVTLLIDGGWVPSNLMARAQGLKATEYAKVMAHERAAAPPPAPVAVPPAITALFLSRPVDAGAVDARADH